MAAASAGRRRRRGSLNVRYRLVRDGAHPRGGARRDRAQGPAAARPPDRPLVGQGALDGARVPALARRHGARGRAPGHQGRDREGEPGCVGPRCRDRAHGRPRRRPAPLAGAAQDRAAELRRRAEAPHRARAGEGPGDHRRAGRRRQRGRAARRPAPPSRPRPRPHPSRPTRPDVPLKDIDDREMPLLEHLLELRTRLMYSALAIFVAFVVAYFFSDDIFCDSSPGRWRGRRPPRARPTRRWSTPR